jgi:hypothetical protein
MTLTLRSAPVRRPWAWLNGTFGLGQRAVSVAEALDSLDRRAIPQAVARVPLAAQGGYAGMDCDSLTISVWIVPPDKSDQLWDRNRLTLTADQRHKEAVLLWTQVNGLSINGEVALGKSTCKMPSSKVLMAQSLPLTDSRTCPRSKCPRTPGGRNSLSSSLVFGS